MVVELDAQLPGKAKKRCRISRNKKRYWKKGTTKIQDAEDFLHEMKIDEAEGGVLWERKDENLFTVDRKPDVNSDKLTRRQMAALMKRLRKKESMIYEEHFSSPENMKKTFPKKVKKQTIRREDHSRNAAVDIRKPYDLWSKEEHSEQGSAVEEYYLRITKKKLPREPNTLKHVTSILPHVEVDDAGASYNPPVSKYLNYVAEAAKEEAKKVEENEKIERQLALAPGEKFVTEKEKEAELGEGLVEVGNVCESEDELKMLDSFEKNSLMKRKTKPVSRKAQRLKLLESERKKRENMLKLQKEQMRLVFSTRKLNQEITEEMRKRQELAEKRRKRKLIHRFAGTQRLGRGKFEPCEKPVLLAEELPGSLREVKPQGSIILERLKSLQKRNMLSIPGEKIKRRKLKKKLRFKEKEDRKHKEVKLGTRMM